MTTVSTANRCEQSSPRLVTGLVLVGIALAAGCRSSASDSEARALAAADPAEASARVRKLVDGCAGFTRALDRMSRVTGRLLVGLVDDALDAGREMCPDLAAAAKGRGAAHQLARARLVEDKPEAALAELAKLDEPAIRLRRAELLDRLGRTADALGELEVAIARAPDPQALATKRLLQTSLAARTGKFAELGAVIAQAPLDEREALAHRAATDLPGDQLAAIAGVELPTEVIVAIADRVERMRDPAVARPLRELAAKREPALAEHWDALGRARIASGDTDGALAAWDKAIELAPAQPAYRLAPITALGIAGDPSRARTRANELAKAARAGTDVELVVTASAGAATAGDPKLALALAIEAKARRPGDGRLAFIVAGRLAEAGDLAGAANAYAELLACGAHGQAWHRHEVGGKLLELAKTARPIVIAALDAKRTCETVEPEDLATYVDKLRAP